MKDEPIYFCGKRPAGHADLGTIIIGMKGSGKSSLIIKLLNEAWRRGDASAVICAGDFMAERARRALPKGTPVMRFGIESRSAFGEHLGQMLCNELRLQNWAHKLLPSSPDKRNEFFISIGRQGLIAVGQALNYFAHRKWVPGDYLWLATRKKLFAAVIAETNGAVLDPFDGVGHSKGGNDTWGTMQSAVLPLLPWGAVCDHKVLANPIEVAETREGCVVLEWTDRTARMGAPIFSATLDIAGDEALSARSPTKRLWFSIDEIRSLNKLEFVPALALRGRRSATPLIMAVHEIEGLYSVYGKEVGSELMNLPGMKVFLRIGGPTTARWAADQFGKREVKQKIEQPSGASWSVIERYFVEPLQFQTNPYPDVDNDVIEGHSITPDHRGPFKTRFKADTDLPGGAPVDDPCPMDWYTPRKRDEADLVRLNIPLTKRVLRALNGPPPRKGRRTP